MADRRVPAEALGGKGSLHAVVTPEPSHSSLSDVASLLVASGALVESDSSPLTELSEDALIDLVGQWDHVARWAQGRQVEVVAELASRAAASSYHSEIRPEAVAGEEVAAVLALGSREGIERVKVASTLSQVLWDTHEALLNGAIDYPKAALIASELRDSSPQIAFAVEAAVLPDAPRCSRAQLRSRIAKALIEVDPADADARHQRARDRRRVCKSRRLPNGMASIFMVLAANDAMAVESCVDAAARSRKSEGDARTMDQLRADAIAAMAHHALAVGGIGVASREECGVALAGGGDIACSDANAGASTGEAISPQSPDRKTTAPETSALEVAEAAGTQVDAFPRFSRDRQPRLGWYGFRNLRFELKGLGGPTEMTAARSTIGTPTNTTWSIKEPCRDKGWLADHALGNSAASRRGRRPSRVMKSPPEVPIETFAWGRTLRAASAISVSVPMDYLLDQADIVSLDGTSLRTAAPEAESDVTASAGLRNENAMDTRSQDRELPAPEIGGYGPIPPGLAAELAFAAGSVWRRLVIDPVSGAVLDVGRRTYRPTAEIARHVIARDGYCVAPRCQVQAVNCDLDHTVAFFGDDLGSTSADNLAPLCRYHHRLKTFGGWSLVQESPGHFVWTTPLGHSERTTGSGPVRDGIREDHRNGEGGANGDRDLEEDDRSAKRDPGSAGGLAA